MEEEGDVVYFQTSPELELMNMADLDLKRSIYSEINEHSTIGEIDSTQDNDTNKRDNCDNRTGAVNWIKDTCRKLKRIEFLKYFKNQIQEDVVQLIQFSPLLTEEDHQLLLLNCPPNNLHPQTLSTHLRPNSAPSLIAFPFYVTILVVILAILWTLSMGVVSSIIAIPFLVLIVIKIFSKVTKSHDRHVMQYLKNCEQFLSLLSQSIQTIQEREMVYHGFDRPSLGVPVNRLEHHIVLYQCIALRERVFSLCRQGVGLVRRHVQSLVTSFPLPLELDTPYCYVSLKELSELHDHLGDQSLLGYQSLLGDEKPPHLSLQSLKTASSLFAVTNSELLKRMALSMRTDQQGVSFVREVDDVISLLNRFVLDGAEQLQWSIDYHRRPIVSSQATPGSSIDSTHIDKVASFMNTELHSSDVQILTALNKVRELQNEVSEASEDIKDEINAILNNLYSAERHLRIIIDHLSHKNVKDHQGCKDNSKEDNELGTCRDPSLLPATPAEEDSSSSEDERVYEGIVTIRDEMESRDSHVTQQDEYTQGQREASIKMLHELNSVLAVRRVERLKKSKKNKSKKCLENKAKLSPPSNTSGLEQQPPIDSRENSLIDSKPDSHSNSMGTRTVAQNLRHNKSLTDHATITDTDTTTPGMEGMNLIAFAVASRANVKQEQVYGEDDSN